MRIRLPYGKGSLEGEISENRILDIAKIHLDEFLREETEEQTVENALDNPIGSRRLEELAVGKTRVVIIASDHTRPVPSRVLIPPMLKRIREGNPDARITILIATGCHRGTTKEELKEKFGEEIVNRENIVVHDCMDDKNMVKVGVLPGGGILRINRIAMEADLLVSEGFIEPHFFAGFSGGRKSILPGIASRESVYANHCAEFIADPCARCGILDGNPIHRDMIFAAKAAGLAMIVNVVLNSKREIVGAFAGEPDQAHRAGVDFLARLCRVKLPVADIVVTSNNGYPLDQNVYQAVKGMSAAETVCRDGGVIIMAAECTDGIGGEGFYRTFQENRDAGEILRKIEQVPRDQTIADQWQSQIFARILEKKRVIFISKVAKEKIWDLHMLPADSLEEALAAADEILGFPGGVVVIPEGVSSIAEPV